MEDQTILNIIKSRHSVRAYKSQLDMYKRIKNPWIGKEGYYCIGCSPGNPIGLHMQFYVEDDKTLVATWNPSKNYEGWIGVVHGGIQALMMDEAAGWWVSYFRQVTGVTSKMEVKYIKPVHHSEGALKVRVTYVKDLRSYVMLHAELLNSKDEVCSTAEFVYYQYSMKISNEQFFLSKCELEEDEMETI